MKRSVNKSHGWSARFQTCDSWHTLKLKTEKNGAPEGRFLQWAFVEDSSQASGGVLKL